MRAARRTALLVFGVLGMGLTIASIAWACTPQATLTLTPAFAAPGKSVTVKGAGFSPETPVEIRWNSATGPVLGVASAPDFSAVVSIPADASPNVYFLVGVQKDVNNIVGQKVVLTASAPFGVTNEGGPATSQAKAGSPGPGTSDLWSAYSREGGIEQSIELSSRPGIVRSRGLALGGGVLAMASVGLLAWMVMVSPRRSSSA